MGSPPLLLRLLPSHSPPSSELIPPSSSNSGPIWREQRILIPSVYRYQQISKGKNKEGENALILDSVHRSSEAKKTGTMLYTLILHGRLYTEKGRHPESLDRRSTSINDWFDQRSPWLAHLISTV